MLTGFYWHCTKLKSCTCRLIWSKYTHMIVCMYVYINIVKYPTFIVITKTSSKHPWKMNSSQSDYNPHKNNTCEYFVCVCVSVCMERNSNRINVSIYVHVIGYVSLWYVVLVHEISEMLNQKMYLHWKSLERKIYLNNCQRKHLLPKR